jgi:hypothetical protein
MLFIAILWPVILGGSFTRIKLRTATRTPIWGFLLPTEETGDYGWVGDRRRLSCSTFYQTGQIIAAISGPGF